MTDELENDASDDDATGAAAGADSDLTALEEAEHELSELERELDNVDPSDS